MLTHNAGTEQELRTIYLEYERALVENDLAVLTRLFWSSVQVMRFGVTENLYGTDEIEAFRRARPSVGLVRTVIRMDVVTFGEDCGSVTLEFERGSTKGRQSQMWVRFPEGWRIVSAHVSLLPPATAEDPKSASSA